MWLLTLKVSLTDDLPLIYYLRSTNPTQDSLTMYEDM